ncbi:MAG: SDR family oxidoreductase [Chloroflexota bacterium]
MNLRGQPAIVAGVRRIGGRVALRLAREGMPLALFYRRSRSEAEAVAQEVASVGGTAVLIQADVSSEAEVQSAVRQASEELGGVAALVNLASGYERTPFEQLDGDAWDRAMNDARGAYLLAVHAARHMMKRPGRTRGRIVLFTDWASGETPYRDYLPYLTAKAAVDFMTRALAVELAHHGILVNGIAPGPTLRPPDIAPEAWDRQVVERTPLKRESSVDDIVEMVVTLLRSESITGETIRIDSGRHLAGPGG